MLVFFLSIWLFIVWSLKNWTLHPDVYYVSVVFFHKGSVALWMAMWLCLPTTFQNKISLQLSDGLPSNVVHTITTGWIVWTSMMSLFLMCHHHQVKTGLNTVLLHTFTVGMIVAFQFTKHISTLQMIHLWKINWMINNYHPRILFIFQYGDETLLDTRRAFKQTDKELAGKNGNLIT